MSELFSALLMVTQRRARMESEAGDTRIDVAHGDVDVGGRAYLHIIAAEPLDTPLVRGMQFRCSPKSCYAPDAAYDEAQKRNVANEVLQTISSSMTSTWRMSTCMHN